MLSGDGEGVVLRARSSSAGVLSAFAVWGVFWGGWGALLPAVREASGATRAELGAALFAVALGALPAMLWMGRVVGRLGERAVAVTLAAFGAAIALPAAATSVPALGASLLVLGATSGALDVALNWSVAAMEARGGGRLFNKMHAAFPLGVVVASPAVGIARQGGANHRAILLVMAAVVLASAAINLRSPSARAGTASPRRPRVTPSFALLGVVGAAVLLVENAVEQWGAIHLEETLGAPPAVAGLGPGLYMAALFAGRVAAQRWGAEWSQGALVALTGAGAAAGAALAAIAPAAPVALAGFAVAGLGMAAGMPTLLAVAGRRVPEEAAGASISLLTTASYAGYLVSPPLVGTVADATSLRWAWALLAAVGVAIAAARAPLRRAGFLDAPAGAPRGPRS